VPFHRRRLPHWQPQGKSLFLTWSLRGSLPHNRFPPPDSLSAGKAFVGMDRCLDEARSGPTWLRRPELARIVVDTLHSGSDTLRYYDLHAFAVMPNHVHTLLSPLTDPSKLLQSVKGFSAREANKILARFGESFWQPESYDHWVRDAAEFERIREYIEENPVRAGLAASPEDCSWTSALAAPAP
jgi:REP element-mobilizing transposase RayT